MNHATETRESKVWNRLRVILVAVCLLLPGPALADGPSPEGVDSTSILEITPEDDPLGGLSALGEDELSDIRGGEGTAVNLQDMNATVDGNSITGTVTTGGVSIGANAFTDIDGVSSVVVNSGNNVSIQSSTVINVVISE